MQFGVGDVHLIGKVLDHMDEEALKDLGFTKAERRRAEWVFEDVDEYLNQALGMDWNDQEA